MNFKPIYLYGIILIALIVFLVFLSEKNGNVETVNQNITTEKIPEDEIHSGLKNQMNSNPNKDNVSQQYHEHLKTLQDAVDKNPNDTLKLRELADFLAAAHKTDDAVKYYEKILLINPKRSDIRFSLSYLYYTKGNLAAAEEQNNKVLGYSPEDEMALYNLGAIAATKGDKDKARELWNRVIKMNPDSETGKLASESLLKL